MIRRDARCGLVLAAMVGVMAMMMMMMANGAHASAAAVPNYAAARNLLRQEEATRGIVDDALVARRQAAYRPDPSASFTLSSGSNTAGNDEEQEQ